jgi:prepilin-type N-terminal cleavage/methylation domain-containing protein/prepilin-type processing-associated H-X9-DG protein
MKSRIQLGRQGFTLIELLMVISIIAILAAILLPTITKGKLRARQAQCASNLKQIGIALHNFAHDHDNDFPWQVSTNSGGTREIYVAAATGRRDLWSYIPAVHFRAISNDLVDPRVLVCPSDRRTPALTFSDVWNPNISYWISEMSAYDLPESIVAGDPHMTNRAGMFGPFVRFRPGEIIGWTGDLHEFRGNLLFADGHVEQLTSAGLQRTAAGSSPQTPPTFVTGPGSTPPASPGGAGPSPGGSPGSSGPSSQPSSGGGSPGGGGGANPGGGAGSSGSSGGGLFGNIDEALGGKGQPPSRGPRSSSSSIATRSSGDMIGPDTYLLGNKKGPVTTNRIFPKAEPPPTPAPAPPEPEPIMESMRHHLAMPILEGERINYKAIVLLLLAAYFTFELLRRHRRRRALRRTYSSSEA